MPEPTAGFKPIGGSVSQSQWGKSDVQKAYVQKVLAFGLTQAPQIHIPASKKIMLLLPHVKSSVGCEKAMLALIKACSKYMGANNRLDFEICLEKAKKGFKALRDAKTTLEVGVCHIGSDRFKKFCIKDFLAYYGPYGGGLTVGIGGMRGELMINEIPEESFTPQQNIALWGLISALQSDLIDETRVTAAFFALQLATDLKDSKDIQDALSQMVTVLSTYGAEGAQAVTKKVFYDALQSDGAFQSALKEGANSPVLETANALIQFLSDSKLS